MSTYILQKDLPNAKAGAKYQLTDNGKDYVCYDLISKGSWDVGYPKEYIESNPKWFKKEGDPYDIVLSKAIDIVQKAGFQCIPRLPFMSKYPDNFPKFYFEEDMQKAFFAPFYANDNCTGEQAFDNFMKTLNQ